MQHFALLHNWNICCTLLGGGAKNSKQIHTQYCSIKFLLLIFEPKPAQRGSAIWLQTCAVFVWMAMISKSLLKNLTMFQRKKTRYLDGLSLRLIQSVLNQLKDNFEKSCQSVNVVNILDVIGKKLFWAGFFWVGAEIGVSAKWSYLATHSQYIV